MKQTTPRRITSRPPAILSLACAALLALAPALPVHAEVPAPQDIPYPGTIALQVDASNVGQQIFRIKAAIPVTPGAMTLLYPQWVHGNHGPSNPLNQLAGLRLSAAGQPLNWERDPVNVHAFHVTVPDGVSTLDAEYQFLSPLDSSQGRITMTADMLGVQWQAMTLYPAGYASRRIMVQPSLTLPDGWQYGTALETAERQGKVIRFKPLDLDTLIDSPLFAGRYFKRIDLDPGASAAVHLNLVADNAESLDAKPEQIAAHRAMVRQAIKLFGSRHYRHYDFLLALSDEFGSIGREHHQSSENGVKPGYFTDWSKAELGRDLLPHELTHSWNGKFRRPADQVVPNFNVPVQNSLLWVYEGQTQYWGHVLSARSGLVSPAGVRDALAASAARSDAVKGRSWRALQDTVNDPIVQARRPLGWSSWQRSEDYYVEGMLVWLDIDTRIRELSGDKRSLDDMARAFFGIGDGSLGPAPYTFDDVLKALTAVQPADWAGYLHARLDGHEAGAPLDGLARAGWKLVYSDTPSAYTKAAEERNKISDFSYSLGMAIKPDGMIDGVQWEGVAFQAGLVSGTTIAAVNNRAYKPDVLKAAISAAAKDDKAPLALLVRKGQNFRTVNLDYHGGLRYPHLERIAGTVDRLDAILRPLK